MREDFLWGGSISAAQCEGAWDEDGKSPVEIDYAGVSQQTPGEPNFRPIYYRTKDGVEGVGTVSGMRMPVGAKRIEKEGIHFTNRKGIDFYHRYKEDIALFAEMGFKSLNLSISWARIMPYGISQGVNQKGVEFYRSVLTELKKYNIEPIVTLVKYDMPVYFEEEMNGWGNRQLVDEFIAFAKVCFEEYQDLVKYWITFNEINIALAFKANYSKEEITALYQIAHHQMIASAKAVKLAHDINPNYKIGCMINQDLTYPFTPDPVDIEMVQKMRQDSRWYFGDTMVRGYYPSYAKRIWKENNVVLKKEEYDDEILMNGKVDYYAFSSYGSNCFTVHNKDLAEVSGNFSHGIKNPYLTVSDWGWTMDAKSLKIILMELYDRYQIPIMIVENGMGAKDKLEDDGSVHDSYRIDFLRSNIQSMIEAVDEGVDLLGYNTWGCIDLVAASSGQLSKRYGFIYVDVDDDGNGTFERYRKDSFYWYKKVIASNGEELY